MAASYERSLTCGDILSIIIEENTPAAAVYIEPNDDELTDEDSAKDDETGLIDHLSGNQLSAPAEAVFPDGRRTTLNDYVNYEEFGDASSHDLGYKSPKWYLGTPLQAVEVVFPKAEHGMYSDCSPVELFELFFDDLLCDMIVDQSIIYAAFKGEHSFTVSKEELRVFFGILMVSGLVPVSSRRSFWKNSPVTRNEAVYNAMRRGRFEKIMQFIHFADNSTLDRADKYAKLRPLVKHLLFRFMIHFLPEKSLKHDEVMIEYFGRNGRKQCTRFGYKAWCLNTDDGYLVTFDLHQNHTYEGNLQDEKTFGKFAATVLRNMDSLPDNIRNLPYNIYFDSLFTSFPLLKELKDRNYGGTGSIREERCKSCPLTPVHLMKEQTTTAGAEYITDMENKIVVCRWKDNSVVTVASTIHTSDSSMKVKRYCNREKKSIEVNCPKIIQEYNQHTVGTDRQDHNVIKHRISIRSKKWWWCIFTWLVDVTLQNAWLLHKKCGGSLKQCEFREHIAETYLTRYGTPPKGQGRPLSISTSGNCDKRVLEDIRFDGIEHYLVETPGKKRRRCAGDGCQKVPSSQCSKCNVGLCIHCNVTFHTKF